MEKPKGRQEEYENVGKPVDKSSDFVLPEGFVPPDDVPPDVDASRTAQVVVDEEVLSGAAWEYEFPQGPIKRIFRALKRTGRWVSKAFSGASQQ